MNKIPVLLLISHDIDLKILNSSARFLPYRFFSLAAISYLEDSSFKTPGHLLQDFLNKKIKRVKPMYLIVHLGLAFERYPVEYLDAVLDVKALYPAIKIGMDRGLVYIRQQLRISEMSPEKNKLLGRLSKNRSIFGMDKKTAYLASCLH